MPQAIELRLSAEVGPTIHPSVFGHLAEHLGRCIYDGVWVGEESPIPNQRGIRKDVVAALNALAVPVLRWPGGCFADEYRWRDGIGPRAERPRRINTHWGGVKLRDLRQEPRQKPDRAHRVRPQRPGLRLDRDPEERCTADERPFPASLHASHGTLGEEGQRHRVRRGRMALDLRASREDGGAGRATFGHHGFCRRAARVRMANLAQTVNVLQAVLLTDGEELRLTPTYHAFEMLKSHQGVPGS